MTLKQVVDLACDGTFPELLCCDIEGYDYTILESADFTESRPKVICVETRRHDTQRMSLMLLKKGYLLYCRMGENLFFIEESLAAKAY
jgi:hypothetical protein